MVETVVTELTIDARGAEVGSALYINAMRSAQSAVDRMLDRQMSLEKAVATGNVVMLNTATSVDSTARAWGRLQASIDPAFNSTKKIADATVLADRAMKLLGTDSAEVARVLDAVTLKYDANAAAARRMAGEVSRLRAEQAGQYFQQDLNARMGIGRQSNSAEASAAAFMAAGTGGNRLNRGQIQNLSYQANDVATMALMGAPLTQIAASQGGQIVQLLQQNDGGVKGSLDAIKSGAASAAGAVVSFLGPVGMIATGFGLAATAAGAFYLLTREKSKTLTEVLDSHEAAVRKIGDAYGYAARQAKIMPAIDGRSGDLQSAASAEQLLLSLQRESEQIVTSNLMPVGWPFAVDDVVTPEFEEFEKALRHLKETTDAGNPGIAEFRRLVSERWALDPLNKDLTTAAGKLMDISSGAMQAVEYLGQLERMRLARVDEYRLYGMSRVAGPEAKAAEDALKQRLDGQSDAAMQAEIRARTFAERMEAVRLQASSGDPIGRADRVRVAELQERTRQEVELRDATRARTESQRDSVEQMKIEALTIGRTAGEIETLNTGYRLFVELREQSERTGLPITDEALQNAREFAKAMGAAAEANARLSLRDDLAFRVAQAGRNPVDQEIASTLKGAGLGVDLSSADAAAIRHAINVEKIADAWNDVRDTGMDAVDSLVDSAVNGFSDIEDVAKSIAGDILKQFTTLAISNPIKNGMFDAGLPTLDGMGGIGGFFKTLIGGENPAGRAVADMSVTAAVVNINGVGVGAGLGDAASRLLPGANSNDPWSGARGGAPVGAVGRSSPSQGNAAGTWGDMAAAGMRGNAGAAPGDIEGYIRHAARLRGIDENIAVRVAKSEGGLRDPFRQGESMLKYGREESYGPFQLHMRNGGVGVRALQAGIDPRTNWRGGVDYGLDEAAQKGWGQWFGAAKVGIGNRDGLAGARPIGSYHNGADVVDKSAERTAGALDDVTTSSVNAAKGVGQFGVDLQALAKQFVSGTGGGAGWGLNNLFGLGLSNTGAGFNPTSGGFAQMLGIPGFATGTDFAPGGMARINERGGEIVDLPRGARVIPHDVSMAMARGSNAPSVTVQTTVHNNAGVQVREETRDDGKGGIRQDIYVEKAVARAISRPGSQANQALGQMGAQAPLVRR